MESGSDGAVCLRLLVIPALRGSSPQRSEWNIAWLCSLAQTAGTDRAQLLSLPSEPGLTELLLPC